MSRATNSTGKNHIWTKTSDHDASLRTWCGPSRAVQLFYTLNHVPSLSPKHHLRSDAPCVKWRTQHSLLCATKDRPLPE